VFILWLTASRPVLLGIELPFGTHDHILSYPLFSDTCFVVLPVRRPLWREDLHLHLQCNRWLVRSLRTNNHTLPSHLRLHSLFITSYDSQGLRWRYFKPSPPKLTWPKCTMPVTSHYSAINVAQGHVNWTELNWTNWIVMGSQFLHLGSMGSFRSAVGTERSRESSWHCFICNTLSSCLLFHLHRTRLHFQYSRQTLHICTEQGSICSTAGRRFISDKAQHFGKQTNRTMSFPVSQYRLITKHASVANTSYTFKFKTNLKYPSENLEI
jgi:hypothetical protein